MTIEDALSKVKSAIEEAVKAESGLPLAETTLSSTLKWLEVAMELNPTPEEIDEVRLLEGQVYFLTGKYDAAFKLLENATHTGEATSGWKQIGVFLHAMRIRHGEYNLGLRGCNTAISWTNSDDSSSENSIIRAFLYGHKAYYHLKLGEYDEAAASCDISLEALPSHLSSLRIMAEISLHRNEPRNAIRYLSAAIVNRTEGPHFWDYANRGKARLDIHDLQGALSDFSVALRLDPESAVVLSNIGLVRDSAGDVGEAWKYYSKALQCDYHWAPAHNNRGTLFFKNQDYDQADRAFTTAIEIEQQNALIWFNRALCRFEKGMYGECLSDAISAFTLGYRSWEVQYISGMCKARLSEYSTAKSHLSSIVLNAQTSTDTSSMIWNNIGVIAHKMEDYNTAQECFNTALNVNPLNVNARTNLGRIKSSMSGAELQPTEEDRVQISVQPTNGFIAGLTPLEIFNTANSMSSLTLSLVNLIT